MLPIWPEHLTAGDVPRSDALATIRFGSPAPAFAIPIRALDDRAAAEVWRTNDAVRGGTTGALSWCATDEVLMGTVRMHGADIEAITASVYRQIVDAAHATEFPHLLRVWNHGAGINDR